MGEEEDGGGGDVELRGLRLGAAAWNWIGSY